MNITDFNFNRQTGMLGKINPVFKFIIHFYILPKIYPMKRVSIFLFIQFISVNSQDCQEKIYQAGQLLDKGNAEAVLGMINPCLSEDIPNSIRWQAYRLKAISNLILLRPDSARIAAEEILQINPIEQLITLQSELNWI